MDTKINNAISIFAQLLDTNNWNKTEELLCSQDYSDSVIEHIKTIYQLTINK